MKLATQLPKAKYNKAPQPANFLLNYKAWLAKSYMTETHASFTTGELRSFFF
jgi:hypothetical protein